MKITYCDKCGYYKEIEAILFDKCPNCNTPLIIDDEEADEVIARELDENGCIKSKPSYFKDKETTTQQAKLKKIYDQIYYKNAHKKFEKMGKITDDEVVNFLIDLWRGKIK